MGLRLSDWGRKGSGKNWSRGREASHSASLGLSEALCVRPPLSVNGKHPKHGAREWSSMASGPCWSFHLQLLALPHK